MRCLRGPCQGCTSLSKGLKSVPRRAVPWPWARKLRIVNTPAALEVVDIPHVSETAVLIGSAVVAVAAPTLLAQFRGNRIESLQAKEALLLLDSNTRLVDIRTKDKIRREGVPFGSTKAPSGIICAPWTVMKSGKAKHNDMFEEEVLHTPGVWERTTFVVLDTDGTQAKAAAQALARLGNHHDVYVIDGGFTAWKDADLPYGRLTRSNDNGYLLAASQQGSGMAADSLEVMGAHEVDITLEVQGPGAGAGSSVVPAAAGAGTSVTSGMPIFRPKVVDVLAGGLSADDVRREVMSGLVIGIIALSLSMALGIASESTPAIGLYTAVVAGFLISALGGSRVSIGGPTAAFIPIVVAIAHEYGAANLVICTGMAGAMLVAMGALGLGTAVRFIPMPVVTGFTAGIATYILSTQVKDFLGLGVPGHLPEGMPVPSEFLEKVMFLGSYAHNSHLPSLALALGCFALLKTWPKSWSQVLPSQIVAVVAGTVGLAVLEQGFGVHTGIETIGSHFGADAIPNTFPLPHLPPGFSPDHLNELIHPAFTIALLAAIESLLCARVADGFIGDKHNPNTELIAQGVANIASAAFGGLPATGALARTAANVRAGGRTPVSGMIHALTVLAVILWAPPVTQYVPLPTLSAVLVMVALNMGEWHNFTLLRNWPEKDVQLFLVAFCLTMLQDVSVAVEFGMVAAVLLFVRDVTSSMHVHAVPPGMPLPGVVTLAPRPQPSDAAANGYSHGTGIRSLPPPATAAALPAVPSEDLLVPHNTAFVEVTGSLLFGAGELLEQAVQEMHSAEPVQTVVLSLAHVSVVDVSGLEVLEEQLHRVKAAGKRLVLCGLSRQPLRMLSKAGFLEAVGRENVHRSVAEAMLWVSQHPVQAGRGGQEAAAAAKRVLGSGTSSDERGGSGPVSSSDDEGGPTARRRAVRSGQAGAEMGGSRDVTLGTAHIPLANDE